uniref:RING-type E3 ubiquitin transferase n=1 Tax=Rhizophora mucronata TaxID=61149 RepID=A0A2P2KRJ1_RHIMU
MGRGEAKDKAAIQAELLRQNGNTYFNKSRYAAAIDAYTEAITLCPNVAVYWTNRALCHRKRKHVSAPSFASIIFFFIFHFCFLLGFPIFLFLRFSGIYLLDGPPSL